jgi:hypothetical protein
MKKIFLLIIAAAIVSCTSTETKKAEVNASFITDAVVSAAIDSVTNSQAVADPALLEKGVKHAASLWRLEDGTTDDFVAFVKSNFIGDTGKRKVIFTKISNYLESVYGNLNEISMDLRKILDEDAGEIDEIDRMAGNYSISAHLQDDLYANKIAFVVALNFPYYTLAEKEEMGPSWSREQWAMARMGDIFVARVPAEVNQQFNVALGDAEMYIAEYNIEMGHLRTDDGRQLFPDDMVLLSHWNLRDELKADYADAKNGPEKQEMIAKVMERIIYQDIPKDVINNPGLEWAPFSNKVTKNGAPVEAASEQDARYQLILNIFKAHQAVDKYFPEMNTAILRKFSWEMEIAQEEVEQLFDTYLRSPQLKEIASVIKGRLGRDLRPYDIWYDGFKSRSTIPEELLTSRTSALYPDPQAFKANMPAILIKMGWSPERAKYLSDKIVVDPARGSGHAAGAAMKGSLSHLRTRISGKGMDYKGYNIAVHEFGHNVEQTISMYDVDYYMLAGVPNTACTEAMAYVFQNRDLMLLGIKDENPEKAKMETLDAAWSLMEIMGVGMVEMKVWKWLYENPEATAAQLKEKMTGTAIEVWNEYFSPVIGIKDSPLLVIYSHMVNTPLYLPNYSYGHVIHFQVEEYLKGKNLTTELDRIFRQGRLTPQQWMVGAVGSKISTQPLLNKVDEALKE